MRILLATRNEDKVKEFALLMQGHSLVALPISAPELPETGTLFSENAEQKLKAALDWYHTQSDLQVDGVMADDSGLCVQALWGGPGVMTALFGQGLPSVEKNKRMLQLLSRATDRSAQYVCVLAYSATVQQGETYFFEQSCEGSIALEVRGGHGFGFDPIFIPNGYTETFAEIDPHHKNKLSHRGKAASLLQVWLGQFP